MPFLKKIKKTIQYIQFLWLFFLLHKLFYKDISTKEYVITIHAKEQYMHLII